MKYVLKHSILFFIVFINYIGFSQVLEVCGNCTISSLNAAIAVAKDFDTILVRKGTYKEYDIVVDKPLTIIGENYPIIDGERKGEIITIISDDVTVSGLFIINVGTSYTEDYAAIRVRKSKNFVIKNLVLEKLFFGIYIEKSHHGKVFHNKVIGDAVEEYNSGNGIQSWYSHHIEIEDNYVEHVRDGIYLEFSDDCLIKNNVSALNVRYGLHFMFSNDDIYQDNTFENNGAGVAVMFSEKIKMYNNIFKEN
jgi:nitrous oxidase accessory protein